MGSSYNNHRFLLAKWSPSVLVMSSCGKLKHASLDGSREYTSMENSRGTFQCVPLGSVIGTLLDLLLVYDLPGALEALKLLFVDDVKMMTRRKQNINLIVLLFPLGTPWDCFFLIRSGTPIPVSKLVKDLGVRTDNAFFPSDRCTKALNKPRRCSFQESWIWYASVFVKPRGRGQPYGRHSKVSYKVGNWHLPPSLRRETAVATTSGRTDYHIQDINGSLGCWSQLTFSPSHRLSRGSVFSVRVVKYWDELPASVVMACLSRISRNV